MRTHFEMKKLMPCYSREGRCRRCKLAQNDWPMVAGHAVENIWALREHLLEPVRLKYGRAIRVKRCFMCWNQCHRPGIDMEYNRGECADITAVAGLPRGRGDEDYGVPEVTREENLKIGRMIEENFVFDRLVYEFCDDEGRPEWLRVSYKRNGENRGEVIYNY